MKTTRHTLLLALSAGLMVLSSRPLAAAGEVPTHPDKLSFPAFTYTPRPRSRTGPS